MRAIDHLVLPVTTLTLARSRLAALGFAVAPDAHHPFGTGNCCVFFENRTFLEPITILDRLAADRAAAEGLFFVKRIKRFTERLGEGFAMVALKSDDAESDRAAFEKAGIGGGPTFRFTRQAKLPDGSEAEVGFALAFADFPPSSAAGFFACQHLAPETIFQSSYMRHPNGVVGISGIAAVAERPDEFAGFLKDVSGVDELRSTESAIGAIVGAQTIGILTPAEFRDRYGTEAPEPRKGIRLAAVDMVVADLDRPAGFARSAGKRHNERIVVRPSPGLGTVLSFGIAENG